MIESYAYARTGYHRGLDALRRAGWKGTARCRGRTSRTAASCARLYALGRAADAIGETDEAARCQQFLHDSDPSVPLR